MPMMEMPGAIEYEPTLRDFEDPLRIVEFDQNDFPVRRVIVEGGPVVDAFNTIATDTQKLVDAILKHSPPPANSRYGQLPPAARTAGLYESTSAALDGGLGLVYVSLPAEVSEIINARTLLLNDQPGDNQNLLDAKNAARNVEVVREMARYTLSTGISRDGLDLNNARMTRDLALKAAEEAVASAKKVTDPEMARYAREAAAKAQKLARALDVAVKQRSAVYRSFIDPKGNLRVGTKVGIVVGIGIAVGGALTWIFVFGGGRKYVEWGKANFYPTTIQITIASVTTQVIVIDVLAQSGVDSGLIDSIQLLDAPGSSNRLQTLTDPKGNGTWTVDGLKVKFQPNPNAQGSCEVLYVLEGISLALGWNQNPAGKQVESESALIVLNFPQSGQASDFTVAANDWTSPVNITVPWDLRFRTPATRTVRGASTAIQRRFSPSQPESRPLLSPCRPTINWARALRQTTRQA